MPLFVSRSGCQPVGRFVGRCTQKFLRDLRYNYNERHFIQALVFANVRHAGVFSKISGKRRMHTESISREMFYENSPCTNIHWWHMLPLNEQWAEHTNNHLAMAFQKEREKKLVPLPEFERLTSQTAAQATTGAAVAAATVVCISN